MAFIDNAHLKDHEVVEVVEESMLGKAYGRQAIFM